MTKFIQSKRYLTLGFRSAYAKYLFPFALSEWQSEESFPSPMQVERIEETIPFLFSYPAEKYTAAESLLFKSIDSSHNLTHLRVCTSTLFCSEEVETWMNDHRFRKNWLKISMIFVISRVSLWFDVYWQTSLNKKFMVKNCKCFSSIPPLDLYLNGTPAVTFKGMLIDIATYIQI